MRLAISASIALLILSQLLAPFQSVRADNWPQWRGANHDGVSREKGLPTRWSETEGIAWKLPLPGMGGSTPAIWGDRIFLTSEEGSDLVVMCVSTAGKELWKKKVSSGRLRYMGGEGNGASASPATDGKHVWTFFGTGEMACHDVDGKEAWKFNAEERYGKFRIQHGMHITPLLDGDRLYFSLLHSGAWVVVCLDKATGYEIWKHKRQSDARAENEHSYASAMIWRKDKEAFLVIHGNDYATGHRLEDGSEVWRVGELNPKSSYNMTLRFVASPVVTADLIVVPSAKNGPVVGIKPDAKGLVQPGGPHEVWRMKNNTPDVSSPLVHDGLVYLCRERSGPLICLDAKTGEQHYSERLHSAVYRASPVYADGHVYLTARDGTVTVVKAGPKFETVAVNRLKDQTSASPAISNGRIYVRGWEALYAIGPNAR